MNEYWVLSCCCCWCNQWMCVYVWDCDCKIVLSKMRMLSNDSVCLLLLAWSIIKITATRSTISHLFNVKFDQTFNRQLLSLKTKVYLVHSFSRHIRHRYLLLLISARILTPLLFFQLRQKLREAEPPFLLRDKHINFTQWIEYFTNFRLLPWPPFFFSFLHTHTCVTRGLAKLDRAMKMHEPPPRHFHRPVSFLPAAALSWIYMYF